MPSIGAINPAELIGRLPVQEVHAIVNGASSGVATIAAPTVGNILLCCAGGGAAAADVSGIVQTNVAWSMLVHKVDGTNEAVSLWKGVVSDSPGTTVTVSFTGTIYGNVTITEWTGLSGTLDQSLTDTTTNNAKGGPVYIGTGIVPTNKNALVFFLFAQNDSTLNINIRSSLAGLTSAFPNTFALAYGFPGRVPVGPSVTGSASSTYATLIASIT